MLNCIVLYNNDETNLRFLYMISLMFRQLLTWWTMKWLLLKRLEFSYGFRGNPLQCHGFDSAYLNAPRWSYLETLMGPDTFCLPQGSVLGPLLLILFTADITSLIPSHSAAGDVHMQAYVHGPPYTQLILAGLYSSSLPWLTFLDDLKSTL